MKFTDMPLSPETLRAISDLNFTSPTPIQEESISILLQGYDLIGQSQTGTGKTAAFGIPLIERIEPLDRGLQAVVLCPTRELCIQVSGDLRRLLKYHDSIRVVPVYGGQPIDRQIQALRGGVQIVVGTPGRFIDHLNRRTIKPAGVTMVVLDEADEMLNMGFIEDMETILSRMPQERQTALFSATMPEPIVDLAARYLNAPKRIQSDAGQVVAPKIEEVWFDIKEKLKPEALSRLIEYERPDRMLVFCNTKKRVETLASVMKERGIQVLALHGDLNQLQRDLVMKRFRTEPIGILIATDVAARGLDVENIDIVVNYDVPEHEEYYVHRIGRTARAGKSGKAFTFVVGREYARLEEIASYTGHSITQGHLPTLSDLESRRTAIFLDEIRLLIDENGFDHRLDHFQRIVDRLDREGYAPSDVAAALISRVLDVRPDVADDLNAPSRLPEKDYANSEKIPLIINIGTRKKVRAKDIVGAIAGETGIPGHVLGEIRIDADQTMIEVPKELVSDVLQVMDGATIKGLPVRVTKAGSEKPAAKHKPRRK